MVPGSIRSRAGSRQELIVAFCLADHSAHDIVTDKARAFAFLVGGSSLAMRVNLPPIAMPERSCLRSSLAEKAGEIRAGISEAVKEALG